METWVRIKGFENYEVSGNGFVRNALTGAILKPTLNTWSYPSVTLCSNNKRKNIPVHRLVALAFIPNVNNLPEVNHLDEDKTNNAVWNLEWATKSDNINHGTRTERANEKKLKPVVQCSMDGRTLKVWRSLKEAEQNGFSHSAISDCCRGKRKSHGGFMWRYAI